MSMKPPVWRRARSLRAVVSTTVAAAAAIAVLPAVSAAASAPPDGSGYELVSPVDKLGGLPTFPTGVGTFLSLNAFTGASSDGNRVLWMSVESFADATSSIQMSYQSTRTANGWKTAQASPDPVSKHPFALVSKSIIVDATDDLSRRIIPSQEPLDPLIQGSFGGIFKQNIFLQETEPTILSWVSRPNAGPSTEDVKAFYQGRDETASHILFNTVEALTPNAAGMVGGGLYDHTGGQTVLVNVDGSGNPLHPCGADLGYVQGGAIPTGFDQGGVMRGAVTSDGSRIAFTVPDRTSQSGDPSCADPTKLYVRKNGTSVEASADQRTIPDALIDRPVQFAGGSLIGPDKVFFTSDQALNDDALDGEDGRKLLYEYDVDSGNLVLVTPNDVVTPLVDGVVAVSDDGAHVYFTAQGQLTPDASATPGTRKMYMYADEQITYIAEINDTDAQGKLIGPDVLRPARLSPDGTLFAFQTADSLGAFDAAGQKQIYIYDAEKGTLSCISCPSDGSAPTGGAAFQRDIPNPMRQLLSRNVLDDGRVYFDTSTSLVPRDDNGVADVYEWDSGQVTLISGGHGSVGSFLIDSANQGHDVFFVTTDSLVGQDTDGDLDIYDARVGGGFPGPPPAPPVCLGDQCQGQPSTAPALPIESSSTVFGNGNASAGPTPAFVVRRISAKARQRFARRGAVSLVLEVRTAGTARAVARARIGGRARIVGSVAKDAARARTLRLSFALSAKARQQLAKSGKLKVTILVTYTGAGSRKATLTLVRPATAGR